MPSTRDSGCKGTFFFSNCQIIRRLYGSRLRKNAWKRPHGHRRPLMPSNHRPHSSPDYIWSSLSVPLFQNREKNGSFR
ncbi:hypothetical protein HMPREF9141_2796 [Prevotella multiformis DSM 16608]|uniref:Uncharacterized protein n=1 Tax=Prevotella multiformis DSM 16608 TaxID=888743 RepID=F0FB29_9BACT|nr:hypothetical protein HMPREF9141_2796 [Prevotella multiformis DSM 16608]